MPKKYEEISDSEVDRLFYSLMHITVSGAARLLVRFRAEETHHIMKSGRGVLAFNHLDGLDTVLTAASVPDRHITVLGKREIMEAPVIGWLFRQWGAITIDRPQKDQSMSRAMVESSERPLLEDRLLQLYIPGTRTPGFKPGVPKRGFAKFAQDTESPVVPAVIKGSDCLTHRLVVVKYAEPLPPPTHRREHEEYSMNVMEIQRQLFDSIDHPFEYLDPLAERS